MPEPYADTLATVATGRTNLVARLRAIASRVEELPLTPPPRYSYS